MEKKKLIDVKKIILEKSPKLYKYAPAFLIRYLQKILHEDEVNSFIHRHREDSPIDFCLAVMEEFNIDISFSGLENIPPNGRAIIAMNHPLGGMDAMALVTVLHDKRPDLKFIVNDVLLHLDNLSPIFVGVNKLGATARASLREVDKAFQTEDILCIFPSGLVSRKINGIVTDLPWKKTFISRATKYDTPVIPTYIDGKLSNFFYRLYTFRKNLGIKGNIEMLYLVNELYKQKNKKIHIKFHAPIEAASFNASKSDLEWAEYVKDKVYQLRNTD